MKKFPPRLTVIVQAYNISEEEITKTLDSLAAQTDSNFKILIFDNGSVNEMDFCGVTDNYKMEIEFVKVKSNLGIAMGRNFSVSNIKTEFFSRIDAGDAATKEYIKDVNSAINSGSDLIIQKKIHQKGNIPISSVSACIMRKNAFVEYPDQIPEDFFDVLYFMSEAKNISVLKPQIDYDMNVPKKWIPDKGFPYSGNFNYWRSKIKSNQKVGIRFKTLGLGWVLKKWTWKGASEILFKRTMAKINQDKYENSVSKDERKKIKINHKEKIGYVGLMYLLLWPKLHRVFTFEWVKRR